MSWWWRKLIGKKAEKKAKELAIEKQIEAARKLRAQQARKLAITTASAPSTRRRAYSTTVYSTPDRRDYHDSSDDLVTGLVTGAVIAAAVSDYDSGTTTWSPSDSSSSSDSWSGGGGDSGGGGSSGDW